MMRWSVRFTLLLALSIAATSIAATVARAAGPAVYVGIDAEFGLINSTSAQAIEKGARIAVDEINRAGGVLGGRPLELVITDNKSSPARAKDNLLDLSARKDLVAVLCGRFSPVVLDTLDLVHANRIVILDPWASADGITDNGRTPNYVFRLSLRDSLAMPAMLNHARIRGMKRVALLLPNTGWGRSNAAAAEQAAARTGLRIVASEWYNWGDRSFAMQYAAARAAGAEALVLVANDLEGVSFVREMATLTASQRMPVISHWGITGGRFFEEAGSALAEVDFSVVQTFSFLTADPKRVASFMQSWERLYDAVDPASIASPVGVGHAYDLVHILAQAVNLAGSTETQAVRDALEKVRGYKGLVRNFEQPFSPGRHDALSQDDVFMAEYGRDGRLVPLLRK